MEGRGVDHLAELRDGLIALLARMESMEEDANVDLTPLRLDLEKLLTKLERNVRGRRGAESAIMTFDRLLVLDDGFNSVASQWAAARRSAGLTAASEVVSLADLQATWSAKWGLAIDYAWRARSRIEDRVSRTDMATRARTGNEALPVSLVLDLRYGTDLPLARIGEFFDVSASAIQARLAAFEARIAEEIALNAARASILPTWNLDPRSAEGSYELRGACEQSIVFEVVPTWPDRESGAGRPRESGALFRRVGGATRVWAVVDFSAASVAYLPEARAREFVGGSMGTRNATIDQIARLAPRLGFATLQEVVDSITRADNANEA